VYGARALASKLVEDYRDLGATQRRTPRTPVSLESLVTIGEGLATIVTTCDNYLPKLDKALDDLSPVPSSAVLLLLTLLWSVAALLVVTSKNRFDQTYRFTTSTRVIAKYCLPLALFMLVLGVPKVVRDLTPLPSHVDGFLTDLAGTPLPDVLVRVESRDGRIVGASKWNSDDKGFYVLTLQQNVFRTARLVAVRQRCAMISLPLTTNFEISKTSAMKVPTDAVVFSHAIPCASVE
jgi:hypothetical protein